MKLTGLEVRNLRAITSFKVDLRLPDGSPRSRLVLLGANGAGKTTLLQAVGAVLGRAFERAGLGASLLTAGDVRDGAKTAEVFLTVQIEPRDLRRVRRGINSNVPARAELLLSLTLGSSLGLRVVGGENGFFESISSEEEVALDLSRTTIADESAEHAPGLLLPAGRGAMDSRPDPISRAALRELEPTNASKNALSRNSTRFDLLPERLALAYAAPAAFDPQSRTKRLWTALARYVPGFPVPIRADGLTLYFSTKTSDALPLETLSQGQRALLLIAAEVAFRAPNGLVLIDEPEQHLHPRWQKSLLDLLPPLAPNAQFIFATQSPYLAAYAPDDVVRIGDEVIE